MQSDWQTLIASQTELNHSQLPEKAVVPLDDLKVLLVGGEEDSSFLQNLLTNDVQALQVGEAQLNGFCNPKGRLLAQFLILRTENDFQLIMPSCQIDFISQRLSMFKLRAKVDIAVAENLCVTGINANSDDKQSFALPYDSQRGLHVDEAQKSTEWLEHLFAGGYELSTPSAWHRADVEAGIGQIYQSTREMFTPQQINFDLNGGVSFKKGCYPGQEVVARLHYLGKPNRRLFIGELNTPESVSPGSEVRNDSEKVAGHVYDAAVAGDTSLVLISLKLADSEKPLHSASGEKISGIAALSPVEE